MNYDFNTVVNDTVVPFPVAADVDNVIIQKVEYISDTSQSGNDYEGIQFMFERNTKDGKSLLKDFIYKVNETQIFTRDGESEEDALKRMRNEFLKRLLHYASKYGATKESLAQATAFQEGEAKTFENFANKFVAYFTGILDNRRLYVKTFMNKNGYTILPAFVPFLQEISEGACKMSYTKRELGKLQEIRTNIANSSNNQVEEVEVADNDDFNDIDV